MKYLDGKVVALTGAGRGIGRGVALLAAAQGARVVVNDAGVAPDGTGHDSAPAQRVVDEITKAGGEAIANFADVSTMAGGESVIKDALDAWGRLDGVVTLAAVLRNGFIVDMTEEQWDEVIKVNLKGTFTVLRAAAPVFRNQGHGSVVTFCSGAGLNSGAGFANYGASKGGVAALTRALAHELLPYGVRVNSVAPRAHTRLLDLVRGERATGSMHDEQVRHVAVPKHSWDPNRVAPMTVYLLSDEAAGITARFFEVHDTHIGLLNEMYPAIRSIDTDGTWELGDLAAQVRSTLLKGIDLTQVYAAPQG